MLLVNELGNEVRADHHASFLCPHTPGPCAKDVVKDTVLLVDELGKGAEARGHSAWTDGLEFRGHPSS